MPCRHNRHCLPVSLECGNTVKRVCAEVKRVFDVSLLQKNIVFPFATTFSGDPTGYTLTDIQVSGPVTLTDVNVTPIANSQCSRVRYTASVPLTFTAANPFGQVITGTTSTTFTEDLVMCVPKEGAFTPRVEVSATVTAFTPAPLNPGTNINCCLAVLTKIVADTVMVIPTYGYPIIPPAQEYAEQCPNVHTDMPIFPRF